MTIIPRSDEQTPARNDFTARFSTGDLPVTPRRYRLIVSATQPTAQHARIVHELLGLGEVISLGVVDPVRGDSGWEFSADAGGVDPELGIRLLFEAYVAARPGFAGTAGVPALIDVQTGHVVNNEEVGLANELESAWTPYHAATAPNLYPEALRGGIDRLNGILLTELNDGMDAIRTATTQEEYDAAHGAVETRFRDLDEQLGQSRYLMGDDVTDSDVLLYTLLVRYDVASATSFGLNAGRLADYAHLWEYARDLYQRPGFGSTTDFDALVRAWALAETDANPHGIIPRGPDAAAWAVPSSRGEH